MVLIIVQGPRAQIDRGIYRREMQAELNRTPNLTIVEASVEDLGLIDGRVRSVKLGRSTDC